MLRIFYLTLLSFSIVNAQPTISYTPLDAQNAKVTITLPSSTRNYVYQDYLHCSVDHPDITLSEISCNNRSTERYDKQFKKNKKVYTEPVTMSMHVHADTPSKFDNAHVVFDYYQKNDNKPSQTLFALHALNLKRKTLNTVLEQSIDVTNAVPQTTDTLTAPTVCTPQPRTFSQYVSDMVQQTQSFWLRLLFALLLGALLSLTPCIYPMIPITIGILHSQGNKKTLGRSVLLSVSYTMGIATTFALLGLLAAFTGQMMGALLSNPIVILSIVALLMYLAGSMIGLYNMYTPRFLQQSSSKGSNGSVLSAFAFGAASGTIASPCLSPGLVLLLSIVTALGSKLLGFVLLFTFGVGLSLPLLIIGSFSGALSTLPKAGMWMVEVKQFFGFMMLAMCLYFLQNILPWHILLWLTASFVLVTGIFYLYGAHKVQNILGTFVKNIVGAMLIASSVFVMFKAYQAPYLTACTISDDGRWQTNYKCALQTAKSQNKPLLIDIGGPACPICKAIDNKMFHNKDVLQTLEKCILLKINGADTSTNACSILHQKYQVVGFPTILLVHQQTEELLARWGGELYDQTPEEFIVQLEQHM